MVMFLALGLFGLVLLSLHLLMLIGSVVVLFLEGVWFRGRGRASFRVVELGGGGSGARGFTEQKTVEVLQLQCPHHFLYFSCFFFHFQFFHFHLFSSFAFFHFCIFSCFFFLSFSFIIFPLLSFSFIFFFFVGCSKSDLFWASISLRFLLTFRPHFPAHAD